MARWWKVKRVTKKERRSEEMKRECVCLSSPPDKPELLLQLRLLLIGWKIIRTCQPSNLLMPRGGFGLHNTLHIDADCSGHIPEGQYGKSKTPRPCRIFAFSVKWTTTGSFEWAVFVARSWEKGGACRNVKWISSPLSEIFLPSCSFLSLSFHTKCIPSPIPMALKNTREFHSSLRKNVSHLFVSFTIEPH